MSTYTNYYGLEKPAYDDVVDVAVINSNYDSIDSNLHRAEAVGSNIGFAYNPEITYNVGDYCLYNNTLYKCVQQVSVAEPFDSAKWSVTKVTDDLASGSEVVANPSGTASTTLTKLEVDGTIYGISGGGGGSTVTVTPILQSGTAVADIEVDNVTSHLYAPTPTEVEANPSSTGSTDLTKLKVGSTTYNIPSGGSNVSVSQTLSSGTEVAGITVNGNETKLYAPTPTNVVANPSGTASTDLEKITIGSTNYNIPVGSEVIANPSGTSGTNLTRIKIDGTDYNISGGGSGDSVSWNQITQSGTKIAEVTINSTTTDVYAPNSGGGASALTDLTDVTITSVQDNQDLSYDSTSSKWINKTKQVSLTMSEYNALPDTKLTDGISYFITDMNVVDGYTDLIGTLTAGSTSLTISSELLTTDSTIDIYTSAFGVNPTNVVLSTGSVTLTFESQQSDLSVKVRVSGDRLPSVSGGSGSVDDYLTSTVTVTEVSE